jgi:hypothetical protein
MMPNVRCNIGYVPFKRNLPHLIIFHIQVTDIEIPNMKNHDFKLFSGVVSAGDFIMEDADGKLFRNKIKETEHGLELEKIDLNIAVELFADNEALRLAYPKVFEAENLFETIFLLSITKNETDYDISKNSEIDECLPFVILNVNYFKVLASDELIVDRDDIERHTEIWCNAVTPFFPDSDNRCDTGGI